MAKTVAIIAENLAKIGGISHFCKNSQAGLFKNRQGKNMPILHRLLGGHLL